MSSPLHRFLLTALLAVPAPAALAQTMYGLTPLNLVTFSATAPGVVSSTAISNLSAGQTLVGLDSRPATGELYALGYSPGPRRAQLYHLNPGTGRSRSGAHCSPSTWARCSTTSVSTSTPCATSCGW